jgi:crotonobetainyl-CoA:carnitine CoA-transferase CaiB-like acyl-CoA transferase
MGPLNGIRILDLTSVVMGPFATSILGDLGADVIKLESLQGDVVRGIGPSRSGTMGGLFLHANRSKRSIAVDLKTPEGLDIALRLAATVDVLFYNIRPRAMERLGLSYDAVRARKADILYVGAFGFGQDGPYRDDPAYDDLIQGLTALPALMQQAGSSAPRYVPVNLADRMVGLYAGNAILAGLLHRNATGQGQKIDIPMFETMASVVLGDHLGGQSFVPPLDRGGYRRLLSHARVPFRTADGYLCLLLYTPAHRTDFAALLDKLDDTRASQLSATIRTGAVVEQINECMVAVLAAYPTQSWLDLLAGSDIPHSPMHTIETLVDDPHLRAVGFFADHSHPSEGRVVTMKVPSEWSVSKPAGHLAAPILGQHSREILREIALDEAEIDSLIQRGIAVGGTGEVTGKAAQTV